MKKVALLLVALLSSSTVQNIISGSSRLNHNVQQEIIHDRHGKGQISNRKG